MLLNKNQLDNILFIDIETVPATATYQDMSETGRNLWDRKHMSLARRDTTVTDLTPDESYAEKAGIFAEFGKVVCISVGYLKLGSSPVFRVKSYFSHNEKELLEDFAMMLKSYFNDPQKDFICGHNVKEFDIPFLCRRLLIHGIEFPKMLDIHGKKPWEISYFIDTLQLWKFGDFKNFTSLKLLAYLFDIPSPKEDIDGSQVAGVYYQERDLERIARYCERDVVTVAKILFKWYKMEVDDLLVERVNQ